jgi:hypothetical protein
MKKSLLAFPGLLLILQLNAQTGLLTLAENKLHGPVRSVATNVNWLVEKFGEWETASVYWNETAEFNKAGLLTSSSKEESTFRSKNSFSYNKKNQLAQWKEVFGKQKEKQKQYVRKYVYDANGREIELNFYGDDGGLSWKEKKHYHEDGSLKEVFLYGGEGSLITHSVYTYNDSEKLQSVTAKNSKKETVRLSEYEYDEDGNRTGEVTYDKNSNTMKTFVWVYENGARVSETKTTTGSNGKRAEQIEFNKEGNETSLSNLDNYHRKTVYTYDSRNNWITATFTFKNYEGKKTGYRMVREINYF